uniref:Cytochrome c oxidase subunit 3 n=1 Tax=Cardiochiles fuscipennis TaxID=69312 RepID=A0A0A6ZLR0_9HYME|nr:cytochrome c oxidase subunit III [Cardiochiles fuscipennis]
MLKMNFSMNHSFHLVTSSPWPLLGSLILFNLMIGFINYVVSMNLKLFIFSFLILQLILFQWWRDVIREGLFLGDHTILVNKGLRLGMFLFIISEVMFFFSFFWMYFHMFLSPSVDIGNLWPPKMIYTFNPMGLPLLNTLLLLCSGYSISMSHFGLLKNNFYMFKLGLFKTILLGLIFLCIQFKEYNECSFTISDSVFGSSFFLLTGFHGLHVVIGVLFLMINYMRLNLYHFSALNHKGFEFASWYWHFVDVVWLFVYLIVYWLIYF